MKEDYCTGFFEFWYTWKFERIYIGWMCQDHDNTPNEGEEFKGCANTDFYKDTWRSNLIGAVLIATIASTACWVKYFNKQRKRL